MVSKELLEILLCPESHQSLTEASAELVARLNAAVQSGNLQPGRRKGRATDRWGPGGFNGFYFSFITLSTVGYGDITPVSRIARWLAAMEAMTGTALCGGPDRAPGLPLFHTKIPGFVFRCLVLTCALTRHESALTEAGCDEIDEVHAAFLKNDDKISVIPKNK